MPTSPAEIVLPEQNPRTFEAKIEQVHQRQAMVEPMLDRGNPQATEQAHALAQQYHVRDMAELGKDVYRSAAHEAAPAGLGWIRVSEHPELLRERLGVNWTDQQIHEYLQPDNSDFRAEIYLPDPRVYGPDVKPVIAIKGSNGPVAVPDGIGGFTRRESALEDWIENARQGMGLETDHADRAMNLAVSFQNALGPDQPFENVGHSKGAVGASANTELTGMPAYIFNGAGLHPNTVTRYAEQHHLSVHNNPSSIHSYHVKHEILTDAQVGIQGMDTATRAQLGLAARQLGELSEMTNVRALAQGQLAQALPYDAQMQKEAIGLVDYLATHSGREALKGMPVAAGAKQIELPAKMRDAQGQLVDRPSQPTLAQVSADAGPLMNVVSAGLAVGVAGKRAGDVVATGGRGIEQADRWIGGAAQNGLNVYGYVMNEDVQGSGRLVAGTMHIGGAAVAEMRVVGGHVQATADRGLGVVAQLSNTLNGAVLRAGSHLPYLHELKQVAEREDRATAAYVESQRVHAAGHLKDAHRDAVAVRNLADNGANVVQHAAITGGQKAEDRVRDVGALVNHGYQAWGSSIRSVTDRAPEAGATVGVLGGGGFRAAQELQLNGPSTVLSTRRFFEHVGSSASEAIARHAEQEVMLPSLDARTRHMEGKAIELMHQLNKSSPEREATPVTPGENPSAFLEKMLDSAKSGDWAAFRNDTQTLANMQPGRDMHTHAVAAVDMQQQHATYQQAIQQQALAQQQAATQQQTAAQGMSR